jgi:hypothetical protein
VNLIKSKQKHTNIYIMINSSSAKITPFSSSSEDEDKKKKGTKVCGKKRGDEMIMSLIWLR